MRSLVKVAARSSPLSRKQVEEVQALYPHLHFDVTWVETTGDKKLDISLREMEKTDFFTREIDELILNHTCRIAIHSAKDLPDPLPQGLALVTLTEGVSPHDCFVYNKLPENPIIGISSIRREETIRKLYPKAQIKDIRGTIERRLSLLDEKEYDGVVMAEAALLRLGIKRQWVRLNCETAPLQGRLAIIARSDDHEIFDMFKTIQRKGAKAQ